MPEYEWIDDEIFVVHDFFSLDECTQHIDWSEAAGFGEAPINTSLGPVVANHIRNNARVMRDDGPLAEELWLRCRDFVPLLIDKWQGVGLNERFRYYRYDMGQQFDWHSDGYFRRSQKERSHYTFMVYLNDDFEGGATTIENRDIQPKAGMALGFVHHLVHKGQPVTAGRKYVVRTDVMYRLD